MTKFYANALLKNGKIMFWWSGNKCKSSYDFYKDFYYSGMSMNEELASGEYSLVIQEISAIGSQDEENFYRQFEIHEDSKGRKPYKVLDRLEKEGLN